MNTRVIPLTLGCVAIFFGLLLRHAAPTVANQIDLGPATDKICAVMSGTQKPDGQSIQLMTMMDGDLADMDPVSLGLFRGVLAKCPAAYRSFHSRRAAVNPFPAGSLYTPVTLLGRGQAAPQPQAHKFYPLLCRGGVDGMTTVTGLALTVTFRDPGHPAADGLAKGQCSWLDRALRPNEPRKIFVNYRDPHSSKTVHKILLEDRKLTFWVANEGTDFLAHDVTAGSATPAP